RDVTRLECVSGGGWGVSTALRAAGDGLTAGHLPLRMARVLVIVGLWIYSLSYSGAQQGGTECLKANAKSCGECIQAGPNCGWCIKVDFLQEGEPTSARCDDLAALKAKGCPEESIQNPRGRNQTLKDNAITNKAKGVRMDPANITQIRPQQLQFELRSGEPQTFNLTFRRAEDYPIDLYYLMDLSYSMKDDLENVKRLGTELMLEMEKITSDFRIGFGSFVEKTVMPYISTTPAKLLNPCTTDQNCTSPFSYKNVLSLTNNGSLFNVLVGKQQISGNLDSPEGGFDAIMQVAVCGEQIGWRNVTRLLVFSTDAGFHFAGDGKLGGIVLPNDGKCHMQDNMYTMSHYYVRENGRKCSNISLGDQVQFEISVTAHKCPTKDAAEFIKIKPLGFTEEVEIQLKFICECACQKDGTPKSPDCHHGNGTFECGACRECVQCRAFQKGEKQKVCNNECFHFNYTMVDSRDKLPQPGQADALTHCKEKDADDCWFYFTYSVNANSEVHVHVVKDPECPSGPDIIPIVAGVVAGIVLIGLALLLIWKLLMIIHDRREFAKFEKEKMNAKWDAGENPIYKSAVTTVVNPKYEGK
ncbi:hypothetical protein GDO78_003164, partial [Eleutherodactylus coqui]